MEKAVNITIDPAVRFGKSCIRGTRVAVVDIINLLAAGFGIDEIPGEYKGITKPDVLSALEFSGRMMEKTGTFDRIFLKKTKADN